jgi:hypothetical protein
MEYGMEIDMSIDSIFDELEKIGVYIAKSECEKIYLRAEEWHQAIYNEGFQDGKLATKLDIKLAIQAAIDRL